MKIKTADLLGPALDWAVAKCEKLDDATIKLDVENTPTCFAGGDAFEPSIDWSQAGPIIEREFIELRNQTNFSGGWEAWKWDNSKSDYIIIGKQGAYCPTPLIAAMRCYVASKLGDEVDIPEELAP